MSRLAIVLLVGCGSTPTPTTTTPPAPGATVVEIASVSLAADCGTGAQPADPVLADPVAPAAGQPSPSVIQGSMQEGGHAGEAACEQTTMQLSIKGGPAGAIQVKRIDLLDPSGKVVGRLKPRNPSRWDNGDYKPWDERVAAGQQLTASYALSAPDWAKLPGGQDPTVAYRVRVTLAIGNEERTFDKPATIEGPAAALPEGVVT